MTSLTLYEIANEYRSICDQLMDSQADEQTIADTLEGEAWALEVKAQNYGFVIRNIEATAEAIAAAEKQMYARRKVLENRVASLKLRLKQAMEITNIQKIESPHFVISIKKNPEKVDIFEAGMIPCELYSYPEPPPPVPDKTAIKAAIKAGQEVPGARIIQETRLDIK